MYICNPSSLTLIYEDKISKKTASNTTVLKGGFPMQIGSEATASNSIVSRVSDMLIVFIQE